MASPGLVELLTAWREAERRWERVDSPSDVPRRARAVIAAWVAYQDAALAADSDEFMLVADDDGVYIGATEGVTRVLGYTPSDLVGTRVLDLAAPDAQVRTPVEWAAFLAAGRQDGLFPLRAKDGRVVALRYQARAHHPIPGFHLSRLWPDEDP